MSDKTKFSIDEIWYALESGDIGVWFWDNSTGKVLWSDHAYRMLGYYPNEFEMSYEKWVELLHPEDIEYVQLSLAKQMEIKKSFTIDFRLRAKDGSYKWIRGSGKVIKYADDGSMLYLTGTLIDITEKKNAEILLQEKLYLLEEAEKIAKIGSWELDIKNNKLFWSNEIYDIFEIDKQEFGASCDAFISTVHPDDREKVSDAYWESVRMKKSYQVEHRLLMSDGRIKYVIERGKTFYNKDGEPIRSIGTVQDITEKVLLEKSVKEQEIIFKSIFDRAPVGIIFTNKFGDIILINDYLLELLEHNYQDLKNKNISEIIFSEDYEKEQIFIQGILNNEIDYYRIENRYVKRDGSLIWMDSNRSSLKDEDGNIKNLISVVVNINDKKIAEQEIIKAKEEAERANQAKSTFLANMSHEIRTPLNGIIGISQLLIKENLPKHMLEYVKHLNMASHHLLDIINDILDFSSIESGEIKILNDIFSLKDTIDEVIKVLYYRAKEKKIEFTVFIDPLIPAKIIGDPLRVKQILINLLGNAIKFTEIGYVSLDVFIKNSTENCVEILFVIKDTGIGINDDKKQKLFTPFFQGDQSVTKKYGGTGLGLTIVKRLLDVMNGNINFVSEPGKGTTFYVTLKFGIDDSSGLFYNEKITNLNVLFISDLSLFSQNILKILESLKFKVTVFDETFSFENSKIDIVFAVHSTKNEEIINNVFKLFESSKAIIITNLSKLEAQKIFTKKPFIMEKPVLPSDIFNAVTKILFKEDLAKEEKYLKNSDFPIQDLHALIVEDNVINQIVLQNMLKQFNISSDFANDGLEAVNLAKKKKYDIVFMDIQMPNMDGYEATRQIRMIPDYVDIPIIAVSAHAFKADADKSIEAGMNDHLTKPVSMNELFKTISKWVKLKYTFSNEPKTDSVSEIPFLDFQDLKMRGSDPENIKFLVNLFVEEINRDIPIIKQCIQENEIEKLQKIIHKHKGASGNVSLVDIHKNLVEIDKLLKAKTEPKMIKNLFDKFFDQIDILNSYKETLEGSRKEIVSFKKISKDDIEELTKLLLDNNLKAIEKYEDMKYGLSSVDGLLTNQLGLAISNLNFTEAFMILDELKKKGLL
ncbi:MAG: hypothetical protein C0187_05760 [Calditerrivibrio nitroreducens]|uniref:Sensory/regulatory protein RpfC n=2 Tax=Calditerrivibrio nitroreducens TaxID=477976 RepID=A0A2J6WIN0_9BACT|nr:MAG: hypothetical protein C0187_05760 [Calditerrivibrio nitroreducens]